MASNITSILTELLAPAPLGVWIFASLLVALLGVVGNVLTWRACSVPELSRSSAYFIVAQVARFDALYALVSIANTVAGPLLLRWLDRAVPWPFCQVVLGLSGVFTKASLSGQLLLAGNRMLAVFSPFRYRELNESRRVWVTALVLLNVMPAITIVMQVKILNSV